jgi:acetylglutamate kinase
MSIVIKLGGNAIEGAGAAAVCRDVATLVAGGERVVVVHGGGPQATAMQERLGLVPERVAGRRITDEATLDVMKMVVGGKLNVDLCAALLRAGARPVGLHGASACAVEARRRPPTRIRGGPAEPVDLGLVGDVIGVNQALLALLLDHGFVPVLACLGASADGGVFNINADVVANRVAAELRAEALVLVSDITGVLRDRTDHGSRIGIISRPEAVALIEAGTITDGMIPKVEEAFEAIAAGVSRVHIVGALSAGDLAREMHTPGSVGTALVRELP